MFFYLTGVSALLTFYIFSSKGIDYRAVAIGALLPTMVDVFAGHGSFGHSFLFPIIVLSAIMLISINKSRLLRRRLLCVNIGIFFSLILEGTFLHETMWWWPLNIRDVHEKVSLFPSPTWWIIRDVVGLVALYLLISIGELYKREKWRTFISTGRIIS